LLPNSFYGLLTTSEKEKKIFTLIVEHNLNLNFTKPKQYILHVQYLKK